MMPLSYAVAALGKVVAPLTSEALVLIAGMGAVFYFLLIITCTLMFTTIVLSKHMQPLDTTTVTVVKEETSALLSDNE